MKPNIEIKHKLIIEKRMNEVNKKCTYGKRRLMLFGFVAGFFRVRRPLRRARLHDG
jgi:hypothetical protein